MPEGDAVWRTARRLDQALRGLPLVECDLRWPGASTFDFRGRSTLEVVPRGKHILHRLDGGWTIHSHLRMDGSWRVVDAIGRPPASPTLRAVLGTEGRRALGWSLGRLDVVRTEQEGVLVGHLGPDILGPDWDAGVAVAHLRRAAGTLGAALLDQGNLAGLGTIWAAESLFAQRLDPFRPAAEVPDAELSALLDRAQGLMRASCAGVRTTAHVHGRLRRPCPRCGTGIAVRYVGPPGRERPLYYCPRCQARGLRES